MEEEISSEGWKREVGGRVMVMVEEGKGVAIVVPGGRDLVVAVVAVVVVVRIVVEVDRGYWPVVVLLVGVFPVPVVLAVVVAVGYEYRRGVGLLVVVLVVVGLLVVVPVVVGLTGVVRVVPVDLVVVGAVVGFLLVDWHWDRGCRGRRGAGIVSFDLISWPIVVAIS